MMQYPGKFMIDQMISSQGALYSQAHSEIESDWKGIPNR